MKPGRGPGVRENACLRTSLDVGTVWDSMHVIFLRSWCYVLSYPLKPHSRLFGRAVVPCLWLGGGSLCPNARISRSGPLCPFLSHSISKSAFFELSFLFHILFLHIKYYNKIQCKYDKNKVK